MSDRVEVVFRGYLSLTTLEQSELIDKLNIYLKTDQVGKLAANSANAREIQKRAVLGPLASTCPCCGR